MQNVPVVKRQKHGINQVTLSASVPGELARKVRRLATQRDVTMSTIVTEALRMYFIVTPVDVPQDEEQAA